MAVRRWWVCLVALALLLAGCSSASTPQPTSTPLPAAADLIAASAAAMKTVTSAHFSLAITGSLPNIVVQSADGSLTSSGDAQGKASLVQLGQLIEAQFVFAGGDLYLKGPTGGFTKLPAALAGQVYDPTAILDPSAGVINVLTSAHTLGQTSQNGSSYVVTGTVPKDVAASLAPGVDSDVGATFTIDVATSMVSSVAFALTGGDGKPAGIQLSLGDLNVPVTVTAPAT